MTVEPTVTTEGGLETTTEAIQRAELLNSGEYDSSNPPEVFTDNGEANDSIDEAEEGAGSTDPSGTDSTPSEEAGEDGETRQEEEGEGEQEPVEDSDSLEPLFTQEDLDNIQSEYDELGGLSPETVESLTQMGIPQGMLDTYLNGLAAIEQVQTQQAHAMVGGEDNYMAITEWAGSNLSDAEIDAFNASIGTDQFGLALQGLQARYEQAFGSTSSNMLMGQPSEAASVFSSTAQVVEAMSDKRYGKDSAYTNEVAAKLARSNVF